MEVIEVFHVPLGILCTLQMCNWYVLLLFSVVPTDLHWTVHLKKEKYTFFLIH